MENDLNRSHPLTIINHHPSNPYVLRTKHQSKKTALEDWCLHVLDRPFSGSQLLGGGFSDRFGRRDRDVLGRYNGASNGFKWDIMRLMFTHIYIYNDMTYVCIVGFKWIESF